MYVSITTFLNRLSFQTKNYFKMNLFLFFLINHAFPCSDRGNFSIFPYTVVRYVVLKDEANGRRKDELSLCQNVPKIRSLSKVMTRYSAKHGLPQAVTVIVQIIIGRQKYLLRCIQNLTFLF